ncbi:hypothetical protein PU629_03910 [Pullulanibacillus sp. KACC 23026]|uniref:hypothetical protein n=1 Tax=Pullulanibacillus sp. KACC 23026 TaxID=3028315 RepID=UPI0023B181B4|nr:hypothetical protein [Pullulanibacillus sp. KACC 23026]WEG13522.1 hypothetical protein PU629_03910 [Pullulanibacillus sp. KACC 23026]
MFFKPMNVKLDALKVNNVDHLSAVSFGSTVKIGKSVQAKKNQGYGQQLADHVYRAYSVHYCLDDEHSDNLTIKTGKIL